LRKVGNTEIRKVFRRRKVGKGDTAARQVNLNTRTSNIFWQKFGNTGKNGLQAVWKSVDRKVMFKILIFTFELSAEFLNSQEFQTCVYCYWVGQFCHSTTGTLFQCRQPNRQNVNKN
jgi:hypothetical protein